MALRLGVDVGGTNTDSVIVDEKENILAKHKTPTTPDVTEGVLNSLEGVLEASDVDPGDIGYAMLGTTHCTNAIVERRNLTRIGVIRIGEPSTLAIEPLLEWPEDLIDAVGGYTHIIQGGHEYDGREIAPLDEEGAKEAVEDLSGGNVGSVSITSVFSPVTDEHERKVGEIVRDLLEDVHITYSSEIGSIGLIERENAAALNSATTGVLDRVVKALESSLEEKGIECRLFFTQNDGTLMSADYALKYPVLTIASGPANSLRGAAFLSGVEDSIIVDVGGTTTDVGMIEEGFPRESGTSVEIGGVRANFRMPDLITMGLGGGSIVKEVDGGVEIGPKSVGHRINEEALIFGGEVLTATDIAVSLGRMDLGDPKKVEDLDKRFLGESDAKMNSMLERCVDGIKTKPGDFPVELVGGGSILFSERIKGASSVDRPRHFEVANAIGAAIAPVSGEIDRVFSLDEMERDEMIAEAKKMAELRTVEAGAERKTVEIVNFEEIPLAYLPGNAVRVKAKAVGRLRV